MTRRKTGGRTKGTPNKATADVKELAQQYAPAALAELARLATSAESETARVSAIRELLDRACGKAAQAIDADVGLTIDDKVRAKIEGEVYANILASISSTGDLLSDHPSYGSGPPPISKVEESRNAGT